MSPAAKSKPSPAATGLLRPYFSTHENPDSPVPPSPHWRGLLIAGPAQIELELKHPMILIHGTYRIQGKDYPEDDRLRLIAVESRTQETYAAEAGDRDPSPIEPPPTPPPPPDPEAIKRMIFSGFFSTDLVTTVELPWKPGTYRVRATLGPIRSNEITVRVAIK